MTLDHIAWIRKSIMFLDQVREKILAYPEAWNQHDSVAMSTFYTKEAGFINVFGEFWKNRLEIQNHLQILHKTVFQNSHLSYIDTEMKWLKPEVPIAYIQWEMIGHTDSKGIKLSARRGIITQIMTQEGEDWLIATAQNTEIVTPFTTDSFRSSTGLKAM
jgi:uncharacterized protein (TIGR02246 family)